MAAGIEDEPALAGVVRPLGDVGADAIGGEAALADVPEAVLDKARGLQRMGEMWRRPPAPGAVARFALLCVASGVFAVICVLAKGALGFGLLAAVMGAPVAEETAKVVLPMMWLEKEPWRFRGADTIVCACLLSAMVFASIENLMYFFVYIPREKLSEGIIEYRLVVCTAMHVICAGVSAWGLVRAWRRARDGVCGFSSALAMPYIVGAMVLHGLYNACATLFSLFGKIS